MINNFYSSVSNGNVVDKCSHKQHHVPEQPYLLRNNFLSEFRTAVEKAKVRQNLGIADSETLIWGNIQGDIADQVDIAGYIEALLSFNYEKEKNFEAGPHFENIVNVRQAAITCLDYLSRYKGEGEEIDALNARVNQILQNLYAVNTLDEIQNSKGGVINDLLADVLELQGKVTDSNTSISDLEKSLEQVSTDVDNINKSLEDINELIAVYTSEDNALSYIPDVIEEEQVPVVDEEGNPVVDEFGQPVMETVQRVQKGGLFVKDLQPQITELDKEINGEDGKISILQSEVESYSEGINSNKDAIDTLQNTTIPGIASEIEGIKKDYLTKTELGTIKDIVKQSDLNSALSEYVKTGSTANLAGITSNNSTIKVDKPLEFSNGNPGDNRRYVQSKSDLLNINPKSAWPGMEVIVIDSATMYILKDYDKTAVTKFTDSDWKMADSLKIVVLESFEEYEALETEGKLQDDVYYYIVQENIEYHKKPVRDDFETQEEYEEALEAWAKSKEILGNQLVTGAWATELEAKLGFKANKSELLAYIAQLDTYKNEVAALQAFFTEGGGDDKFGSIPQITSSIKDIYKNENDVESGVLIDKYRELLAKIEAIFVPAAEGSEASGILVSTQNEIQNIKDDLYGESPKFVTWEALGSEGDNLGEGETLFVKTSAYNNDRKADAEEFNTKQLNSENINTDKVTTKSVILGETTIEKSGNTLKVGERDLALSEELLKNRIIKFDTYSEYISWRNDESGEFNLKLQENPDYWNDWYFLVLDYEGAKPERSDFPEDEAGQAAYEQMLNEWEENTLISYKAANSLYQPKGSYCSVNTLNNIWSSYRIAGGYKKLSEILAEYIKQDDEIIITLQSNLNSLQNKFNKLVEHLNIDSSIFEESEDSEATS